VVAQINAARAAAGLAPLAYDARLELVGDAHCEALIAEGGDGHFAGDGVPPYLRWLLAGGHGFHMENVGSYSSTGAIPDAAIAGILARSVAGMLEEKPPDDGHRRALLDPWITHIGVGLVRAYGELRATHELASEVTAQWTGAPVVTAPRTGARIAGRLQDGWEPEAAEVLWQGLPRPLTPAQLHAARSYSYPPRRAMFYANRPAGGTAPAGPGTRPGPVAAPFTVDGRGGFSFTWETGPHDGVEIVVLWARRGSVGSYVPVAASATVVAAVGTLPPALESWYLLGRRLDRATGGKP